MLHVAVPWIKLPQLFASHSITQVLMTGEMWWMWRWWLRCQSDSPGSLVLFLFFFFYLGLKFNCVFCCLCSVLSVRWNRYLNRLHFKSHENIQTFWRFSFVHVCSFHHLHTIGTGLTGGIRGPAKCVSAMRTHHISAVTLEQVATISDICKI